MTDDLAFPHCTASVYGEFVYSTSSVSYCAVQFRKNDSALAPSLRPKYWLSPATSRVMCIGTAVAADALAPRASNTANFFKFTFYPLVVDSEFNVRQQPLRRPCRHRSLARISTQEQPWRAAKPQQVPCPCRFSCLTLVFCQRQGALRRYAATLTIAKPANSIA